MTFPMPQFTPQGWVCPKCGCCFAPSVAECYRCNARGLAVKTTGGTGSPPPPGSPNRCEARDDS